MFKINNNDFTEWVLLYSLLLNNKSHNLQMGTKNCLFFEWDSWLWFIVYYGLSSWVHFDPSCIHTVYILTIYTMWYRVGAKNAVLVNAGLISMMSWLLLSLQFCILSKFTFCPSCPQLKLLLPFKIRTAFGTLAVKVSNIKHELLQSSFLP